MSNVIEFLQKNKIEYKLFEHIAVFTVQEADIIDQDIDCMHTKNLFLVDRFDNFYLFTLFAHSRLPIKNFGKKYWLKDLSFGSPQDLKDKLNLTPGSVSIFGLINNPKIKLFIDKKIREIPKVWRHPNINTATVVIDSDWLKSFLNILNIDFEIVDIDSL